MSGKGQPPLGLDEMFARLQSQLQAGHFKKALKTCDEGEASRAMWSMTGCLDSSKTTIRVILSSHLQFSRQTPATQTPSSARRPF